MYKAKSCEADRPSARPWLNTCVGVSTEVRETFDAASDGE
jgi:hypothetical protein